MSKKRTSKKTPIRRVLKTASSLQESVNDGLGAVTNSHRKYIAADIRADFEDSLDVDAALLAAHSQQNRWDYLLGHGPQNRVVGLEPHTADDGEISVVIKKKEHAMIQLQPHLETTGKVSDWFWVASGTVGFTVMEKATRRLDEKGITFVGKALLRKHFG